MDAIVYQEYGGPEDLRLEEVEKPVPVGDEVLVRVRAASVNDFDWGLLRGKPFINRVVYGLRKPRHQVLGCDIAGEVEAVGPGVTAFEPCDEVYGDMSGSGFGGFAEYVCVRERALVAKPARLSFEQAAAVPHAMVLLLQGMRDGRRTEPGQKILFNGAGGGVGTLGIQIAKLAGAEVTAVDGAEKLDMLRSLGADHVIDYAEEDFTGNGERYDLILDVVAKRSIFDYRRALAPGGMFKMIGGPSSRIAQVIFLGSLVSLVGSRKITVLMHRPNKHLASVNELLESGDVVPVIDSSYPLSEVPEALRRFGEGRHQGKIVITV